MTKPAWMKDGHPDILKGVPQIAGYMRVDQEALRAWIKKYDFPVYQIENRVMWITTKQDCMRWLRTWRLNDYMKRCGYVREPEEMEAIRKNQRKLKERAWARDVVTPPLAVAEKIMEAKLKKQRAQEEKEKADQD